MKRCERRGRTGQWMASALEFIGMGEPSTLGGLLSQSLLSEMLDSNQTLAPPPDTVRVSDSPEKLSVIQILHFAAPPSLADF